MLLPVFFLIYDDDRKGAPWAKIGSRKSHIAIAILLAICSVLAVGDVWDYPRGSWRAWSGWAAAAVFFVICARELYCATQAPVNHEADTGPPTVPKEL
jgi:hypothetical protein